MSTDTIGRNKSQIIILIGLLAGLHLLWGHYNGGVLPIIIGFVLLILSFFVNYGICGGILFLI